jgi:imidazolonepropionase-like amidohydrolase
VDGGVNTFAKLDTLETVTLQPARYLGAPDAFGTVEPGKVADLVLLEGNPLEDISNTLKIAGVVVNGGFFSIPDLQQMLAAAQSAANRN